MIRKCGTYNLHISPTWILYKNEIFSLQYLFGIDYKAFVLCSLWNENLVFNFGFVCLGCMDDQEYNIAT
jgi:hypothetical protein